MTLPAVSTGHRHHPNPKNGPQLVFPRRGTAHTTAGTSLANDAGKLAKVPSRYSAGPHHAPNQL